MGKFRMGVMATGLTLAAIASAPAFAVSSKADCNYEGGTVFDVQGATVCLVQIRPEEYRDNEAYDGQQLGVNECNGEVINDGLFCKITLIPAPAKPAMTDTTTVTAPDASTTVTTTTTDDASESMVKDTLDEAADMAKDKMDEAIQN